MSKHNTPSVSIIMPAYNAELYIRESIDSVLRQSFTDFELIIINDGSTDNTQSIAEHYAKIDKRVLVINQKNQGVVATLNAGIKEARAPYIARIDGDDPWFDNKLEDQVNAFKRNAELVLIGGGFEIIDEDGYYIETIFPPTYDRDIRRTMMLRNSFGHAGVMFKRNAIVKAGLYSDKCGPTEDFDMWIKLSKLGKVANLPRPIYRYRINRSGISQQNSAIQTKETTKHIERQWQQSTPTTLSRREIRERSEEYVQLGRTTGYGVALKDQFLSDNAQIGMKLIRRKKYKQGFFQLLHVASTGRSGLRAVQRRLKHLDRGSLRQSRTNFTHDNE